MDEGNEALYETMSREAGPLLDSVRRDGHLVVGRRLAGWIESYLGADNGRPIHPGVLGQLGEQAVRHLEASKQTVANRPGLRSVMSRQVARLVRGAFDTHQRARRVRVNVVESKKGALQLELPHDGALVRVPFREHARLLEWGTAPFAADEDTGTLLELSEALTLRRNVNTTLASMREIARSRAFADLGSELDVAGWVESRGGYELEMFVRDVVNAPGSNCSRAPLFEDILEATDLRVQYPNLERRRGVRVQVSWIRDYDLYRRKAYLIPYTKTVVFICPFTLAQVWRWDAEETEAGAESDVPLYWNSDQRIADEEAAQTIQQQLAECMRHTPRHPLGPAATAPEELVALIRRFVAKEAVRCHTFLRTRQLEKQTYGSSMQFVRDRLINDLKVKEEISATDPPY